MSLTLYFHPLASFCWKTLIALYENDTPFTGVIVDRLIARPSFARALREAEPYFSLFPMERKPRISRPAV